jgi:rhodanese-related sulfurtransferase
MKKLILIALVAITAAFAQSGAPARSRKLTRAEFDQLMAKPSQVLVIDVRRPDELTSVGGFPVYLSIQLADLEKSLAFIPAGRTLVTVSNHANRAVQAADLLESRGFKVAGAIGVQNYQEEGGKILKIAPPQASGEGEGK